MRLLLDTHILIACVEGRAGDFGPRILAMLDDPETKFCVSVASLWEIAIKHRLGKLPMSSSLDDLPPLIMSMGIDVIAISALHALANVEPEPPTRDPFDRLLLAQCRVEGLRLVTIDRALVGHPYAIAG